MATASLLSLLAVACDEPPPAVVRPLRPEALSAEVARLVDEHVQAVSAAPSSAELHGELGLVYEANELWPEARDSFAHAATLAPADPSWALHRSIATLHAGDFERALADLRALVARAPDFAPARHRLGNTLLDTADLAGAAAEFEATVRLAPRSPEGHVGLGRVALAQHDFEGAAEHLEAALALDARHAMTRFLLAEAYRRLGRAEEAERLGARAAVPKRSFLLDEAGVRAAGYCAGTNAQMGRAKRELAAGNARAALEILEDVAELNPERVDVLNNLAIACSAAGEQERAVAALEASLRLDEGNAMTHAALAMAWLDRGDAARALASAERAVALEPASGRARLALGRALLRQERFEEAREALLQAHALDRKDPFVRLALGEACWRLGELVEAETHLRAAVAKLPGQPDAHVLLARVLLQEERTEEARSSFELARALAPRSREVQSLWEELSEREER